MIGKHLLNSVLTVLKYTPGSEEWGDVSTYIEAGNYECRIQPVNSKELENLSKEARIAEYKIFTSLISELSIKDRVSIRNGVYKIVEIRNAAGAGHHFEIYVKRVQE